MSTTNNSLLSLIHFVDISKWSATMSALSKMKTPYPLVSLLKVLKRSKEPTNIEDNRLYKRITVRLYGMGVLQRDEVFGKDIGTKKQFVAHSGQLIISRIDARNGAFGIVPDDLEGAIVTNDFWLFDVSGALPQYLILVLSSSLFQQYWQTQSSGTTNRQRVDEQGFLASKIVLPTIEKQNLLVEEYNTTLSKSDITAKFISELEKSCTDYLISELGLRSIEPTKDHGKEMLKFIYYRNLFERWEWNVLSQVIHSSFSDCPYPVKPLGSVLSFVNRSWKRNSFNEDKFMYIEIGGINAEANTATANEVSVTKAPSRATQIVKQGDLIIGTTRPYLKRFAVIRDFEDEYVCSSGFQVVEPSSLYNQIYVLEALKLNTTIKQFEALMTGALYPAVNSDQLKQVKIPFPPVAKQNYIANYISTIKTEIAHCRNQVRALNNQAKRDFEEAVFGGQDIV